MPFKIYHYVNNQGCDEFSLWENNLQSIQRGKLKEKIDKLRLYGNDLYPHLLTDTGISGIQKLRIRGNVQLRPLLCRGPIEILEEYTLLMGAKEVGGKWKPKDAPVVADERKQDVINNPTERRIERVQIL